MPDGEAGLCPARAKGRPTTRGVKEGVHGGTSKPRAKAAAKLRVLARGDEVASQTPTMGSPMLKREGMAAFIEKREPRFSGR